MTNLDFKIGDIHQYVQCIVQVVDITTTQVVYIYLDAANYTSIGRQYHCNLPVYIPWQRAATTLDSHPLAKHICLDCNRFCNQRCYYVSKI